MKKLIFVFFVLLLNCTLIFSVDKKSNTISFEKEIEEYSISELQNDIEQIKTENDKLKIEIENLKIRHVEQSSFFENIISMIFWVVGFIGIIITLGFSLFIWVFKEPKIVFSKIMNARKEIKELTKNFEHDLETEYKQQSTIFLLGKKGLYSYTEYDWERIKIFASIAEKIAEDKRKSADWYFIGSLYFHKREFENAVIALKQAIEIDNNKEYLEIAYKDLGNTYDELGCYNDAITYYKKALLINDNNYKVHNNMGISYTGLGEYKKAFECFNKCLEIKNDQEYVYTNYFEYQLTQLGDFDSKLLNQYNQLFRVDNPKCIKTHSIFEMLDIYRRIIKGVNNIEELLDSWKQKGYFLVEDSNYREIKKWIDSQPDVEIKNNLLIAYNYFERERVTEKSY
nr:tetratricopeptide repeat protein [uncultured Macellibacteroides sp.]